MKRLLSMALALIFILALIPVHADGVAKISEDEAGNKLKSWGALKGTKDGDLMMASELKRQDAVLILIRMMGKEEEAAATAILPSFEDIKDKYYNPYIAFAQAQGWAEGRSRLVFGYNDFVTRDEFYALMLRALGYDYKGKEFSKVAAKAEELGLTANLSDIGNKGFNRGSAFLIMYNTLQQTPKGKEDKLSLLLGYEKKPAPVVFGLNSAVSKGLRAIELEFNRPVKAKLINNIKITDGKERVDVRELRFYDDNSRLILLLEKPVKNDSKLIAELTDVLSDDNGEKYSGKIEIEMFDNIKPEVRGVSAPNPKTLVIEVSEPINIDSTKNYRTSSEIIIDGKEVSVKIENAYRDELIVELYKPLSEGRHTVEISGFKDYASYTVAAASFEVDVEKDEKAPELESASMISAEKLRLVFSEVLYDKGEFKVNGETVANHNIVLNSDDRKVIDLNLVNPLKSRTVIISYKGQKDIMRNAVKSYKTYKIEMEDDVTAPTIASVSVERINLLVKFSEPMSKRYGIYTIVQDGKILKKQTKIPAESWVDETTLKIDISNLPGDIAKPYNIVIEGFKDGGINMLEMSKYETTFNAVDTAQPVADEAYSIVEYFDESKIGYKEIKITFSEEMDKPTLEDAKNYNFKSYFDGKSSRTVRGDQADFSFKAAEDGKSLNIRALGHRAWIDGVIELTGQKDKAGNYILTKQVNKYKGEANKLVKATLTGSDEDMNIEVEFANPVELIDDGVFALVDEAGKEVAVNLVSNEGRKAVFTPNGNDFILTGDALSKDGKKVSFKVLDGKGALDVYGTAIKKGESITLVDKITPTVDASSLEVLSKRKISLVFSEPMNDKRFIVKLLKAEGGVATFVESGKEKNNTVSYSDESALSGERKHRKIVFETLGDMPKGSYKLVISQAEDKNDNFLNNGYELSIDFYTDK